MIDYMKTRSLEKAKDATRTLADRLFALLDCHYYAGMDRDHDRAYYMDISALANDIQFEIQQLAEKATQ